MELCQTGKVGNVRRVCRIGEADGCGWIYCWVNRQYLINAGGRQDKRGGVLRGATGPAFQNILFLLPGHLLRLRGTRGRRSLHHALGNHRHPGSHQPGLHPRGALPGLHRLREQVHPAPQVLQPLRNHLRAADPRGGEMPLRSPPAQRLRTGTARQHELLQQGTAGQHGGPGQQIHPQLPSGGAHPEAVGRARSEPRQREEADEGGEEHRAAAGGVRVGDDHLAARAAVLHREQEGLREVRGGERLRDLPRPRAGRAPGLPHLRALAQVQALPQQAQVPRHLLLEQVHWTLHAALARPARHRRRRHQNRRLQGQKPERAGTDRRDPPRLRQRNRTHLPEARAPQQREAAPLLLMFPFCLVREGGYQGGGLYQLNISPQMFKKLIVVDAKGHLLGRLASYIAKAALSGQRVAVVRCEGINITGSLFRNKVKFSEFLRKRLLTNPRRTFVHYRSPSRIFWRAVRGMLPHKIAKGAAALARVKVFEGVPAPYDTKKREVVPDALRAVKLSSFRKYCTLGDLSGQVGWGKQALVASLEEKRRARASAWHTKRLQSANAVRKALNLKEISQVRAELAQYGY